MAGCDDVYYCVVDARGWLSDPSPLFHTNVEGTRNVLDIALEFSPGRSAPVPGTAALHRFIFTSSYVTVGRRRGHRTSETDITPSRRSSDRMVSTKPFIGSRSVK